VPQTRYTRGRTVEYLARELLLSRGYHVIQSAGSRSPVDLLAWHQNKSLLLVQVKRTRTPIEWPGQVVTRYHEDLEALRQVPKPYKANVQLWLWTVREGWRFYDVMQGGICEVAEDVA